jgi:hypothetical protein
MHVFPSKRPAGSWPSIRASDVRASRGVRLGQHAMTAEGLGGRQDHGIGEATQVRGRTSHVATVTAMADRVEKACP